MRYDLTRRLLLAFRAHYREEGEVPIYTLKSAVELVAGCKEKKAVEILKSWDRAGLITPSRKRPFWVVVNEKIR